MLRQLEDEGLIARKGSKVTLLAARLILTLKRRPAAHVAVPLLEPLERVVFALRQVGPVPTDLAQAPRRARSPQWTAS